MVVNMITKVDKILEADNNNPAIQAVKKAIKKVKDKRMYRRYMVVLYYLGNSSNSISSEEFSHNWPSFVLMQKS